MYSFMRTRYPCTSNIISRYLSSAEISTALRPFYFVVHPDLFGKYPEQRKVNEYSLQQLSALIEAQQSHRRLKLAPLSFYLRQKDTPEGPFKLVKIFFDGNNVRETVVKVLNSCDLPTKYVDKIPNIAPKKETNFRKDKFAGAYEKYSSEFEKVSRFKRKVEEKKMVEDLVDWITENSAVAKVKYESMHATREQVQSLRTHLQDTYGIKEVEPNLMTCQKLTLSGGEHTYFVSNPDSTSAEELKLKGESSVYILRNLKNQFVWCSSNGVLAHWNKTISVKWDSGWNISHIRGALQSLVGLAAQHSQIMSNLEGRTIALGQFTGVSLEGDVFLSIIDVRNEWLSLIKKVRQEDSALINIPRYEKALSSILRDIHICRRKFMPKVSASQYCNHLRQLITSVGDFYGRGYKFPESIPETLTKFEIVVEPEAGPLMVSPTGQFITPSSCPAGELIYYMGKHLDEATLLLTEYSINKHVERALHKEVKDRFGLLELHKDDSVTPALMITCCERLLTRFDRIDEKLNGNILNITHYYSVLTEGVLCIPWNFK